MLCKSIGILYIYIYIYIFYQDFLSRTLTTHRTAGKGGNHLLFHSTTSTCSQTLRHLFATLHVRWLSCIFNRNACLPDCYSMRFTTLSNYHLIDELSDFCFYLFTWWFVSSFFCYSNLRRVTGGLELASTITLVLHANRLTKWDFNL